MQLSEQNRRIIDSIIQKERALCPGALALIGVYGSCLTGDTHARSDLDLLILINDERGRQLASAFVLEDREVGYDLYCTTWDSLREDARYTHPHIAKLMDSEIVYCADEKYTAALEALRAQVRERLAKPFDRADYHNAETTLRDAQRCFASAMTARTLSGTRKWAGDAIYCVESAVMLLNKVYFRRGVRRCMDELSALPRRPKDLCERIAQVVSAQTAEAVRGQLTLLMRETEDVFREAKAAVSPAKAAPTAEALAGTWEEMYSNWRGKMRLAAETGDCHLAFMSLISLDSMLSDLAEAYDLPLLDALSVYDPQDLTATAEAFDRLLAGVRLQATRAHRLSCNRGFGPR